MLKKKQKNKINKRKTESIYLSLTHGNSESSWTHVTSSLSLRHKEKSEWSVVLVPNPLFFKDLGFASELAKLF